MTGVRDPFGIVGTTQTRVFRVEAAVAEGGFGVVYRAYHEAFRSYVALKCLKVPDVLSDEQKLGLLEKFRTEAELLFRLSASLPEIVRPLQFGVLELEDGSPGTPTLGAGAVVPYLAMEWLEGQTLGAFVAGRVAQSKPPLTLSRQTPPSSTNFSTASPRRTKRWAASSSSRTARRSTRAPSATPRSTPALGSR